MLESIQELSAQQAEQFLNTFYFQYGHRSIADLAHLVFGLEQISILAAIAVVDEPVWDGQERSTRYQPFRKTGWHLPDEVKGGPAEAVFSQTAEGLFSAYEQLSAALLAHLIDAVPRPAEMSEGIYRRTLRARAFDVGMDAVRLIQCRHARHLVEQERQQRHFVLFREIAIDLTEGYGVLGPEVRRRLHAGQQDRDALALRVIDDRGEVLLHLRDRQAA